MLSESLFCTMLDVHNNLKGKETEVQKAEMIVSRSHTEWAVKPRQEPRSPSTS